MKAVLFVASIGLVPSSGHADAAPWIGSVEIARLCSDAVSYVDGYRMIGLENEPDVDKQKELIRVHEANHLSEIRLMNIVGGAAAKRSLSKTSIEAFKLRFCVASQNCEWPEIKDAFNELAGDLMDSCRADFVGET